VVGTNEQLAERKVTGVLTRDILRIYQNIYFGFNVIQKIEFG
jgi:hypothetical protein